MFGFFKSLKIAKFETEANSFFLKNYGFGVEIVGSFKLSEISVDIYESLERQGRLNSKDYISALEIKFKSLGYL